MPNSVYGTVFILNNVYCEPMNLVALGRAFRALRQQRGLTQASLARLSGTNQATISNVERGAIEARSSTLERIVTALDAELVLVPKDRVAAVRRAANPTAAVAGEGYSLRDAFAVSDDDA